MPGCGPTGRSPGGWHPPGLCRSHHAAPECRAGQRLSQHQGRTRVPLQVVPPQLLCRLKGHKAVGALGLLAQVVLLAGGAWQGGGREGRAGQRVGEPQGMAKKDTCTNIDPEHRGTRPRRVLGLQVAASREDTLAAPGLESGSCPSQQASSTPVRRLAPRPNQLCVHACSSRPSPHVRQQVWRSVEVGVGGDRRRAHMARVVHLTRGGDRHPLSSSEGTESARSTLARMRCFPVPRAAALHATALPPPAPPGACASTARRCRKRCGGRSRSAGGTRRCAPAAPQRRGRAPAPAGRGAPPAGAGAGEAGGHAGSLIKLHSERPPPGTHGPAPRTAWCLLQTGSRAAWAATPTFPPTAEPHLKAQRAKPPVVRLLHVSQQVLAPLEGRLPAGVAHAAGQRGAALQVVQQPAAQPPIAAPPAAVPGAPDGGPGSGRGSRICSSDCPPCAAHRCTGTGRHGQAATTPAQVAATSRKQSNTAAKLAGPHQAHPAVLIVTKAPGPCPPVCQDLAARPLAAAGHPFRVRLVELPVGQLGPPWRNDDLRLHGEWTGRADKKMGCRTGNSRSSQRGSKGAEQVPSSRGK